MKAIVNNTPDIRWGKDEFHVWGNDYYATTVELQNSFHNLLYIITDSRDYNDLQKQLKCLSKIDENFYKFFKYGFGGNHMWVKQIDDKGICRGDNIVFVNLENIN